MTHSASPLVSIIIPTFNGGQRLEETLRNCLGIQGLPIEILLIDDGSTDGTPERVRRHFPSVHLHLQDRNSGSGSMGRNLGLAMAKGRYVKFLDHDDLIQPRGLKTECAEALRTDADIVMARWGVGAIDEQGRFVKDRLRIFTPPDPNRLLDAILLGEATPYTSAALYKRSYVSAERWDANLALIDDFDWFARMACKGGKVIRVDAISYYWRQHGNSYQGRRQRQKTMYFDLCTTRYQIYKKLESILATTGELTEPRRRLLAKRYYEYLRCFARYAPGRCAELLAHIGRLDPAFAVDASCEPSGKTRLFIQLFGLPFFLRCYGLSPAAS
jgi:glycosyltransferase involved in cell wall biosynthesis